ncbi:proline-rich receptor-like protein kinase PERK10 [Hordeum vulgare subsp. vulgare]|uniref:proline-rich receptor-like protein kinase PERK10 n=1 Tax=Hordeum vulgare subsp. vulgare TaxID=112509 RepID=UPI001D1A331C|nr:proline-rich receptor-like protein kinase PERK10 [Hordeum vulgare subsp. vulgare]
METLAACLEFHAHLPQPPLSLLSPSSAPSGPLSPQLARRAHLVSRRRAEGALPPRCPSAPDEGTAHASRRTHSERSPTARSGRPPPPRRPAAASLHPRHWRWPVQPLPLWPPVRISRPSARSLAPLTGLASTCPAGQLLPTQASTALPPGLPRPTDQDASFPAVLGLGPRVAGTCKGYLMRAR